MKLIGKILWWDTKYERGVITDPAGNEYYFDSSSVRLRPRQKIQRNTVVNFEINKGIKDVPCATAVTLPVNEVRIRAERSFERQRQLSFDL